MKRLLIKMLFLVFWLNANSQQQTTLNFILTAGGNLSQLLTDSVSETKARIGYQLEGMLRYGASFFIQGGLALMGMSSQIIDASDTLGLINTGQNIDEKVDIRFIHIPVQLGYKLFSSSDGSSSFWIAAGGNVDQIFDVEMNSGALNIDDFRKTSFGINATVGIDMWFLTFKLSYIHGITPILKADDNSIKYSIAFSLGVKL